MSAYGWERDEYLSALRADRTVAASECRHEMLSDGRGGGVCRWCELTVDREEL